MRPVTDGMVQTMTWNQQVKQAKQASDAPMLLFIVTIAELK